MTVPTHNPLVDTAWLAAHLDDPGLRLFDCTVHLRPAVPGPSVIESGRADYDRAHIPGAAFLDLGNDLSDPDAELRFTVPTAARLAAAFGAAGIHAGDTVVLYGSTTPMWATRAWWMLRGAGHPCALVLDGGMAKWRAEGRATVGQARQYAATTFDCSPQTSVWADRHEVLAAIGDRAICTLNALPSSLHTGESEVNYGRKGHIQGSVNVPFASLLLEDGTFRTPAELRAIFAGVGATTRARVICYCGGGISATLDALALVLVGHSNVAVYDGSMSEWVRDASLPMSLGRQD